MRTWYRRDSPLCPHCHYDLSGLATDTTRCPECGQTLDWEAAFQHNPRFALIYKAGSDNVHVDFLPTMRRPLRKIGWIAALTGSAVILATLITGGPSDPGGTEVCLTFGALGLLVGLLGWTVAARSWARIIISAQAVTLINGRLTRARIRRFARSEVRSLRAQKVGDYRIYRRQTLWQRTLNGVPDVEESWPMVALAIHAGDQHVRIGPLLSQSDLEIILNFIGRHAPGLVGAAAGPGTAAIESQQ